MKTKLFLALALLSILAIPVRAELTVDDVTSREYLRNYGYSHATIDILELKKGGVNGEKVYLPSDAKRDEKCKFLRWLERGHAYIDSGMDNGKYLREDTKFSPNFNDL